MKLLVLAAGKGSRLQSEIHTLPKVLTLALDKPLIDYVLSSLDFILNEDKTVVVGYKGQLIKEHLGSEYKYVTQEKQLGTGHAVKVAYDLLKDYDGPILITYGDMPLFKSETYKKLVDVHNKQGNKCTLLTAKVNESISYGRIIRSVDESFLDIREEKDCNESELNINELNVGVYVFDSIKLFDYLNRVDNDNKQGEYYLTDVPKLMRINNEKVGTVVLENTDEIYGVNTYEDLTFVESVIRKRGE